MAKRGRIILKESSLRCFKERADDIRRYATVIGKAFLASFGIVHIVYTERMQETLQNLFGSGFIEG